MKKRVLHRNEKEILRVLFKEARPLSTNEISAKSDMSWATGKKYTHSCQKKGLVKLIKKGRKNVYKLNPELLKVLQERKCKGTQE